MKRFIAFLVMAVVGFAAPTTVQNNLVIQKDGTAQSGVLAGNGAGVATATATGPQISTALDLIGSTRGGLLYRGAAGWSLLAPGTSGYVLTSAGAGADPAWTAEGHVGTVTSVGLSLPDIFTVSGSPVTTSGTLTGTLADQVKNLVWAGPASGANAPPTFRSLVTADMPSGTGDVIGPASSTLNAWPLFADTTGKLLKNSDVTYTSPTLSVPDAFVVSSAGSIGLTAGGAAKVITIKNATAPAQGNVVIDLNGGTLPTAVFPGVQLVGGNSVQTAYQVDNVGTTARGFIGRRARGSTLTSLSAVQSGDLLTSYLGGGYGATQYLGARLGLSLLADENWSDTVAGSAFELSSILKGGTTAAAILRGDSAGRIVIGAGSTARTNVAAWGTFGVITAIGTNNTGAGGVTITDSSSSGTVATAVANSFAVPTFAASSATTFTNAANLYIAGDVANGTNVTLTNSYGLWNVGKTRLDGVTTIGGVSIPPVVTNTNLLVNRGATISFFASTPTLYGRRAQGSLGSESAVAANNTLLAIGGSGYDGSAYSEQNALLVVPTETWSGTAHGTQLQFYTTAPTTTTNSLKFVMDGTTTTQTLTGGAGNMTITAGTGASRTLTLQTTTSGGTATNAVVFGATQSAAFNGPIIQKVSALTYASPTSVDVTLGNVYTVTTVNATGSVTFNATAGGTAGQSMTILITNDATSAKTITFGTNFLSTGTLTASAASRHTSITFCSDGTNWYETGRAVMTN